MTLKSALLVGVAICGMAAAPAFARDLPPNIHFHSVGAKQIGAAKTRFHDPKTLNYTATETFTGTLSTATAYHVKTVVLADTWYANDSTTTTTKCSTPAKEKWVGLPKKTTYALLKTGTTTGSLSGTGCVGTFTFYSIIYDLATKAAVGKTDDFTGNLEAKKFVGYNLKLVANLEITIAA